MRSRPALSLSLVRYSAFIAWGRECAPFFSAHSFVVPSKEGGGDDSVSVLRLVPRPVLRPVFSSRLISSRAFLVHPCRSKQEAAFSSITAPSLSRALSRQILRPLPIPFRPSSRFASRRPSRFMPSRFVSPFSSRFVLPDVPHGSRPSCCRAVLFSSSCRPPPMPCRPHRLMTGYRRPGTDAASRYRGGQARSE